MHPRAYRSEKCVPATRRGTNIPPYERYQAHKNETSKLRECSIRCSHYVQLRFLYPKDGILFYSLKGISGQITISRVLKFAVGILQISHFLNTSSERWHSGPHVARVRSLPSAVSGRSRRNCVYSFAVIFEKNVHQE